MTIKNKLTRMKKHIIREENSLETKEKQQPIDSPISNLPYNEVWEQNGTTTYHVDQDFCLVREKRFSIHDEHGDYKFKDLIRAVSAWQSFKGDHPLSSKGLRPEDLFFFDTETTGLGGGVGNTIFLLGHGQIVGDEVIVTQHFLPQPGSEIPLYHSFLNKIDYNTLVTYNGKAFDWPQVKTRHTLIKEHVPKLPSFGHFDLYHGSRRLFKHKLESVKLINVEREILGFERVDDVPGYLAPIIYFDYIDRKDPEGILKIMKHNELDILSLITLYSHISFQILNIKADATGQEKFEVGRWLDYTGNTRMAKDRFMDLIANNENQDNFEAMHHLAFHYKKERKIEMALSLWEQITQNGPISLKKEALLELAKIYEHHFKDYHLALIQCEELLEILGNDSEHVNSEKLKRSLKKLNHRMDRLNKKAKKHESD